MKSKYPLAALCFFALVLFSCEFDRSLTTRPEPCEHRDCLQPCPACPACAACPVCPTCPTCPPPAQQTATPTDGFVENNSSTQPWPVDLSVVDPLEVDGETLFETDDDGAEEPSEPEEVEEDEEPADADDANEEDENTEEDDPETSGDEAGEDEQDITERPPLGWVDNSRVVQVENEPESEDEDENEVEADLQVSVGGDGQSIDDVFRVGQRQVQRCYERLLQTDPFLGGRVVVEVSISDDGHVDQVDFIENELGDEFASCLEGRVNNWVFDAATSGGLSVRKTYVFESSL